MINHHLIPPPDPEEDKSKHHAHDLPRPARFSEMSTNCEPGTLAACKTCGRWFKAIEDVWTEWYPVRWYHFADQQRIEAYRREHKNDDG